MHFEVFYLINFLKYFAVSIPMVIAGIYVFIKTTPYDDFAIMQNGGNEKKDINASIAVALDLSGKIISMVLVLSSSLKYSVSIFDYVQWGILSIVTVVAVYLLFRWLMPLNVVSGIREGNIGVGLFSAALSIASGLLLSGLVSY